jgi:hypothetical protein
VKNEGSGFQAQVEVGDFEVNATKLHGDMRFQLDVAQAAGVHHLGPVDLVDLVIPLPG